MPAKCRTQNRIPQHAATANADRLRKNGSARAAKASGAASVKAMVSDGLYSLSSLEMRLTKNRWYAHTGKSCKNTKAVKAPPRRRAKKNAVAPNTAAAAAAVKNGRMG